MKSDFYTKFNEIMTWGTIWYANTNLEMILEVTVDHISGNSIVIREVNRMNGSRVTPLWSSSFIINLMNDEVPLFQTQQAAYDYLVIRKIRGK